MVVSVVVCVMCACIGKCGVCWCVVYMCDCVYGMVYVDCTCGVYMCGFCVYVCGVYVGVMCGCGCCLFPPAYWNSCFLSSDPR